MFFVTTWQWSRKIVTYSHDIIDDHFKQSFTFFVTWVFSIPHPTAHSMAKRGVHCMLPINWQPNILSIYSTPSTVGICDRLKIWFINFISWSFIHYPLFSLHALCYNSPLKANLSCFFQSHSIFYFLGMDSRESITSADILPLLRKLFSHSHTVKNGSSGRFKRQWEHEEWDWGEQ